MKALDESVIIEVQAARAGEEVKSEFGLVIGRREMGEIPTWGTVISVGDAVPEEARSILERKVLIPNGRMNNVTDPRVVAGEFIEKSDLRQLVTTHWKNIQVIY